MLKNRSKVICAQRTRTSVVTVVALACALGAWGAEPLCWERTPNRPAPAQFDTYHGETLDFRCTFTGFGALPFSEGADVRLWYQTNGMGAAWWSIPATVSSNVLEAAWPPSADPGAERVAFFFGAPSNAYAAAQVRFRNSPGAHPNDLDPPSVLDWQAELAAATNALWESSAAAFMPQSNAYTKSETDARIAELAPRTSLAPATNYTDAAIATATNRLLKSLALTFTNDVCNIVTNEVEGTFGEWTWASPGYVFANSRDDLPGNDDGNKYFTLEGDFGYQPGADEWSAYFKFWEWDPNPGSPYENDWGPLGVTMIAHGTEDATSLTFSDMYAPDTVTATRTYTPGRNALGLARLTDIAPTVSNTVTKAFVENLGIESGIQEETDPVWAGDRPNYATKSALAAVSNEAQVVYRLFSGSNVVLEVTNYNSIANSPKLRLLQLTESNTYEVVWCETNNLQRAVDAAAAYTASATNALAQQSAAAYAPRAWSGVTSGMGVEAPSNTTWLSTPTTVIAGGYEPEKWITSGGAVWLITAKGAIYDFSPSTNNTAYLNISASDGTPMFRIEKTDSYLLPVHADAVSVDGSTLVVDFDLVSSTQPYARVCTDLTAHNWAKEEDGIPAALSTVTWSQTSNGWRCRLSNNTGGNSLFGYFEYLQEGGTKIINEAVMDVSQGILCTDGVHKVRPVYNSGAITWEIAQ